MEAKDTELIQLTEIRTVHPANDVSRAQIIADQKKIREQHEISFKAGYQEAVERLSYNLPAKFAGAKKAGIREVVEWFMKHNRSIWGGFSGYIDGAELQSQLKEWGLKEGKHG